VKWVGSVNDERGDGGDAPPEGEGGGGIQCVVAVAIVIAIISSSGDSGG